jgi:opacity protein-like surface antigen
MVKIVVAAAGVIFLLMSNAHAGSFLDGDEVGQPGDYAGVSTGVAFSKSSLADRNGAHADLTYDSIGLPLSVFIGHQFGGGLRVEGELFYKTDTANKLNYSGTSNNIDSHVWSIGAMGNLYYDFFHDVRRLADGPFLPYVGLGVGFAGVNISEGTVDGLRLWNNGYDTVFAYQAAVGSCLRIKKDILLDISYRYFGTTKAQVDQIKTDYNSQNFLLGVRYLFR